MFQSISSRFQKERERKIEKNDSERKQTPSASTASTVGPYAALGRPGTDSYRAPSRTDHPLNDCNYTVCFMDDWNEFQLLVKWF